ncbi:DUF4381 family protein [Dyella amyloliquefaciens]|uniref:DUF4381 family protein n=1 Tax=Dyella amyloliquefaciens TaxID=1770545 RepID=UPI002D21CB9E|nr:DUF4381 family protein [Dyella amyloliquefaciens]
MTMASAAFTAPSHGPALKDIHLPPPPAWWPPAPGWWIVMALLLLGCVAGFWFWRRQHRRSECEGALLAEVDVLVAQHGQDPQRLAADLHALLRRAALRLDAGATQRRGDAWRTVLASVTTDAPTLDALMSLETALYRPQANIDVDAVAAAVRRWLVAAWRQQGKKVVGVRLAALSSEGGHV